MTKSKDGPLASMHQALDLTRKMYKHAESGTWDVIPDLETCRDQLIKHFFNDYQGERTTELESIVSQIQIINQNLLRLALSARDGMRLELSQLKQAGKAARAYVQHSY